MLLPHVSDGRSNGEGGGDANPVLVRRSNDSNSASSKLLAGASRWRQPCPTDWSDANRGQLRLLSHFEPDGAAFYASLARIGELPFLFSHIMPGIRTKFSALVLATSQNSRS